MSDGWQRQAEWMRLRPLLPTFDLPPMLWIFEQCLLSPHSSIETGQDGRIFGEERRVSHLGLGDNHTIEGIARPR